MSPRGEFVKAPRRLAAVLAFLLLTLAASPGAGSASPRVTSRSRFRLLSSAALRRQGGPKAETRAPRDAADRAEPVLVETHAFGGNGLSDGERGDSSDALAALNQVCPHAQQIKAISATVETRPRNALKATARLAPMEKERCTEAS